MTLASTFRTRRVRASLFAGAALCALAIQAPQAAAETTHTLIVSSILLEKTPNTAVQDWFLNELVARSQGRIELEQYRAGALCNGQETSTCVRDGRADIGISVPAYAPQQFVLAELGALPFMTSDNAAQMRAFYELNQSDATFRSETERLGLVPITYFSAGLAILGAKEPLSTTEDLRGKRIRAVGDGVISASTAVGAQPVAVTAAEMYEAAERGLVDVVFNNMDAPTVYNLDEVLPYWVDAGYGHYTLIGIWMSQDAYDRLPNDLQQIVDEVTRDLNTGAGAEAFADVVRTQCDQMIDGGKVKSLAIWDDAEKNKWRDLTGAGPRDRFVEKAAAAGYDNPAALIESFEALLTEHTDEHTGTPIAECAARFESS